MATTIHVLAIEAANAQRILDSIADRARQHLLGGVADPVVEHHLRRAVGHAEAAELLSGTVAAALRCASDKRVVLTAEDRKQAAEAAGRS